MKIITTIILFLAVSLSFAQVNDDFKSGFLPEVELLENNMINKYESYDFSNLWATTQNHFIYGIIGEDHQRLRIKLITVEKNPFDPIEYIVTGKSMVKGTICGFVGVIRLKEIQEVKELHYGVDDEYEKEGILEQGVLIADYEFVENRTQKHSGIFRGKLYSKWYLDAKNRIRYDDIESVSDGYMNNAFTGVWKSYSSNKEKICNWGDYRVPQANPDFDIGAAEFSPDKKYYNRGWENYHKAWLYRDEEAKKIELRQWWK